MNRKFRWWVLGLWSEQKLSTEYKLDTILISLDRNDKLRPHVCTQPQIPSSHRKKKKSVISSSLLLFPSAPSPPCLCPRGRDDCFTALSMARCLTAGSLAALSLGWSDSIIYLTTVNTEKALTDLPLSVDELKCFCSAFPLYLTCWISKLVFWKHGLLLYSSVFNGFCPTMIHPWFMF